jgi:hypothetical protein
MSFEVMTIHLVVIVNLIIGIRLIQKAIRERGKPELMLGCALLFDAVEWFLWYLSAYTSAYETPLGDAFGFGCRLFIALTVCCLLWFTQAVFRPESRIARHVVKLGWVFMFSALIGTAWEGDWNGYGSDHGWVWMEQVTQNCIYAWMLFETGRYYLTLRKRLSIGLSEPLVVNRVFLWFTYAAWISTVQILVAMSVVIANQEGGYPALIDAGMALFSTFSATMLWLAFFPPRAYENWILSRHPLLQS